MSPRTFFRYFPTKEDVLFGDADERCGRLLAVIAGRPPDEPLLHALLAGSLAVAADYDAERTRLVARKRILESSPQLRAYERGAPAGVGGGGRPAALRAPDLARPHDFPVRAPPRRRDRARRAARRARRVARRRQHDRAPGARPAGVPARRRRARPFVSGVPTRELRSRLPHPVIDVDGHTVEYFPALLPELAKEGVSLDGRDLGRRPRAPSGPSPTGTRSHPRSA